MNHKKNTIYGDCPKLCDFTEGYHGITNHHFDIFWSFSMGKNYDKYLNPPMSQGLSPKSEEKNIKKQNVFSSN